MNKWFWHTMSEGQVEYLFYKLHCDVSTMTCKNGCSGEKAFNEMCGKMGGFAPETLKAIRELDPGFMDLLSQMDAVMTEDGALDKKTKRLMGLSCVIVRMCEDCVYPQAKVAKNYGATKEEIIEAVHIAVLTGGVPCWSVAKKGITRLFSEWE